MGKTITPNFMTYEEWLKANPDIKEEETEETCTECGGDGEVECWHCGSAMDCEACDGTGKVKGYESHKLYEQQIERDKKILAKYLEVN